MFGGIAAPYVLDAPGRAQIMPTHRTISLLLALLILVASTPLPAVADGCDMAVRQMQGCSCCGSDSSESSSSDSSCPSDGAATIDCCDVAQVPVAPTALPAQRGASVDVMPLLVSVVSALMPAAAKIVRSATLLDMPDVLAAQRQQTYLRISTFLI